MVTSETVQFGPMVCAWENAMFYMEGNTKQPKVSDRLHAAVTCKVLMRSASGVAENGAVL